MHKVYVPNQSYHDMSEAKKYGELVFMSKGPINRFNTNHMVRMFATHLASSTKEDYILQTSLRTMSDIACAMFSYIHGCLNLLIYDDGNKLYRLRRIDFTSLKQEQGAGAATTRAAGAGRIGGRCY